MAQFVEKIKKKFQTAYTPTPIFFIRLLSKF